MPSMEYATDINQIKLGKVAERGGDGGREVYNRGIDDSKKR